MSFFLVIKKRDLSDKSRNGEDSKKHRENHGSTISLPDIFSDDLNLPKCVKISVKC